jgi:NADPH:quinone reductase-like Zn-dependent oxidoreductase
VLLALGGVVLTWLVLLPRIFRRNRDLVLRLGPFKSFLPTRLGERCPNGIDVFFDNVGGEVLDGALANLAVGARIALCGFVSDYSGFEKRAAIRNHPNLILQRGTKRGFLVLITSIARWRRSVRSPAGPPLATAVPKARRR